MTGHGGHRIIHRKPGKEENKGAQDACAGGENALHTRQGIDDVSHVPRTARRGWSFRAGGFSPRRACHAVSALLCTTAFIPPAASPGDHLAFGTVSRAIAFAIGPHITYGTAGEACHCPYKTV